MKVAASKAGVSLEEYQRRITTGEKWCTNCRAWHLADAFGIDRTRWDGLVPSCRESKGRRARENYTARPRPEPGRSFVPARDGDSKQARRRVNYFVEAGLMPHPNTLPCVDCGHVWQAGGRRHEYDHHLGYNAAHHEDVEAVCTSCHHARERARSGAASLA